MLIITQCLNHHERVFYEDQISYIDGTQALKFICYFPFWIVEVFLTPSGLLLLEFETIFSAMGLAFQMSGLMILATLTVAIKPMNSMIATNPALAKFFA